MIALHWRDHETSGYPAPTVVLDSDRDLSVSFLPHDRQDFEAALGQFPLAAYSLLATPCSLLYCSLPFDPRIDPRFKHVQRQRARIDHLIVKRANVELRAQRRS